MTGVAVTRKPDYSLTEAVRTPPSVVRAPEFLVTSAVCAAAIAVTLAWMSGKSISVLEMDLRAFHGQPWRLVTSCLPHVDVFHLLFNVYWTWVFGTLIEERFGHVRTLGLMTLLAVGSAAGEYAHFFEGGVGLSGVGYGLFAFVWVLARRDTPRWRDAMDTRTATAFCRLEVSCSAS